MSRKRIKRNIVNLWNFVLVDKVSERSIQLDAYFSCLTNVSVFHSAVKISWFAGFMKCC